MKRVEKLSTQSKNGKYIVAKVAQVLKNKGNIENEYEGKLNQMKNHKLIMDIMSLAVQINNRNDLCCNFEYMGHVKRIDINVYDSDDKIYEYIDLSYSPEFTTWKEATFILSELEDVKRILTDFLQKGA